MFIDKGISTIQRAISNKKFESLSIVDQQLVIKRLEQIKRNLERFEAQGILRRAQYVTVNNTATKNFGLTYIDFLVFGWNERMFFPVKGSDGVLYARTNEVSSTGDEFYLLFNIYNQELTRTQYKNRLHALRNKKHMAMRQSQPDIVNAVEEERETLKRRWKEQEDERRARAMARSEPTDSNEFNRGDSSKDQCLDGSNTALQRSELFD